MNNTLKRENRIKRHSRIRAKVAGTAVRPRLAIFRSNRHLHLQLIDDVAGKTIASATGKKPADRLSAISQTLAEKAGKLGIKQIVFDRGGYGYHGNISKVAEEIRSKGLKF